jgi:hypothetical protein
MISRRPRPGRISPPKAVVSLTPGDGRLPQAGQHGSDSKQGKNQTATDLRISVPLARLPSTAIHPDGHVGYRAAGTDLDGLQRHLAHWLPHHTASSPSNAAHASHHRQHTYH